MKKTETIMLQLLGEIKKACNKKNVDYYVIENELLFDAQGERVPSCFADICMTYDAFRKIRSTLKRKDNRTIESIATCIDMPGVYYRYVDTEALCIEMAFHKVRKAHGIAVNIHIIRNTGLYSEYLIKKEKIMASGIEGIDTASRAKKAALEKEKSISQLYSRAMNKLLRMAAYKGEGESQIHIPGVPVLRFPEGFWKSKGKLMIDNKSFDTVGKRDIYLMQRYGEDYHQARVIDLHQHYQMIYDLDVPYQGVAEQILGDKNLGDLFWEKRNRFLSNYYWDFRERDEEEKRIWNMLFLTEARFVLWKKYYWMKKELYDLYERERYDELYLALSDMNKEVKFHSKFGYVPFFDDEIWKLYIVVLEKQGFLEEIELYEEIREQSKMAELDSEQLNELLSDKKEKYIKTIRAI